MASLVDLGTMQDGYRVSTRTNKGVWRPKRERSMNDPMIELLDSVDEYSDEADPVLTILVMLFVACVFIIGALYAWLV